VGSGLERIGVAQVLFAAISLAPAASLYGATSAPARTARRRSRSWSTRRPGLHHALAHPTHALDLAWAAQLACGVAGFWVGLALFRLAIGRRDVPLRPAGGLLLTAAMAVGTAFSGLAELVVLLVGSLGILLAGRGA
jgi:hypothetical protein